MKQRRHFEESVFKFLMVLCLVAALAPLALILGTVFVKGIGHLDWEMLTSFPKGGYYYGGKGGVLNAIAGSALLAGMATALAFAISAPGAIWLNAFARKSSKLALSMRFSVDILCGVPSIVYGAFGFALMTAFGWRASLLAGAVTVALLIVPMMCKAMDEAMRTVPQELSDTALALGATRFEAALKAMAKQCAPGLCTAVLLAFGRGVGDAASVIFTAGFSDRIPDSPLDPVATLPLAVFFQLGSPIPEVQGRGYAAALILSVAVLCVCVASRLIARRMSTCSIK